MKNRKPRKRKCAVCREKFQPARMMQPTCSVKCAIEKTRLDKQKKQRKETLEAKKKLKSRGQWLRETQTVFNQWIRLSKPNVCISCGNNFSGGQQAQAGHYYTTAARPDLRFNEDNVWVQCVGCNSYKSGNIEAYRAQLVHLIGQDRLDALEVVGKSDWSIEEIQEIKKEYQRKIREFKEAEEMYKDIDPPF